MQKEFNYTVDSAEDIQNKLKDFIQDMRDEFKPQIYKMNHQTFLNMAKCVKSPSRSDDKVQKCIANATQKKMSYEKGIQEIYGNALQQIAPELEKCGEKDAVCLSNCFNAFTKSVYSNMKTLNSNI